MLTTRATPAPPIHRRPTDRAWRCTVNTAAEPCCDRERGSTDTACRGHVPSIDNAAYLSTFPNVGAAVPVTVASNVDRPLAPTIEPIPVFRSLFQVDDQSQPVSSTVRALWGNSASLASVASADATSQATNGGAPRPLDLFSDRNGTFSS